MNPSQLLLLTFNKKTTNKLTNKLDHQFNIQTHIMTFHTLTHTIIKPDKDIIYNNNNKHEIQNNKIQHTINNILQNPTFPI